jgi:hypothetical protein
MQDRVQDIKPLERKRPDATRTIALQAAALIHAHKGNEFVDAHKVIRTAMLFEAYLQCNTIESE